jgi:hypothetical protein
VELDYQRDRCFWIIDHLAIFTLEPVPRVGEVP